MALTLVEELDRNAHSCYHGRREASTAWRSKSLSAVLVLSVLFDAMKIKIRSGDSSSGDGPDCGVEVLIKC